MEKFKLCATHPGAAWPTKHIAYPIGARFAYVFAKLGLTPNAVSLIGLAISLGTVASVYFIHHSVLAALVIFFGLQIAYIIDCADGVLARATNQTSAFGALLDKLCDGLQTLVVPLLLVWIIDTRGGIQQGMTVPLMIFWVISSSLLTHTIWFKPVFMKPEMHAGKETKRGFLTSAAAILIDNPTTRLLLAAAWAFDYYYHFTACYSLVALIVFLGYIAKQYRQLQ